jgi:hypothetical protein
MCYVCQYAQQSDDREMVVTARLAARIFYFLKPVSIVPASVSIEGKRF